MPKKNRIAIYELLFKEGVMVAKKDVHMPKHPELADKNVPNLHVMKAMQVWRGTQVGIGLPFPRSQLLTDMCLCPAVSQVSRLREGTVCLETFLLVPYERGHPVSPRLPAPTPGDRARHPASQPSRDRQASAQRY
jgi:hypothetical protein